MIVWLIINELLSILENVEAIGVPLPAFLRKLLGRLQVSTEAKTDTEEA
ncbi:MAG: phage holin family protein [Oscillospiraceae bacterium]